jgi:exodeoxyribonuclease V gamma subunit
VAGDAMKNNGLKVTFVQDLEEILRPVADFLDEGRRDLDPFEKQFLIVPTAGVRAWLTPQLARTFGASSTICDGVISNVEIGYIGMLQSLLRKSAGDISDTWSIERLTLATHRALLDFGEKGKQLERKYNGYLHAARILADRFDRYSARRPDLIRSWDRGEPSLGAIPVEQGMWQFELWRKVREIIGVSPWPVVAKEMCDQFRSGVLPSEFPQRLMIAGLESISPSNLELIEAMSHVIEIELIFVHQSPELARTWNSSMDQVIPRSLEIPIRDQFETALNGMGALPSAWLSGSFDLQLLLTSFGIPFQFAEVTAFESNHTLLSSLQEGIRRPQLTATKTLDSGIDTEVTGSRRDLSVQIHRAHNLGRQVEVLHDALLHAFEDLENLQPHEVLILCADIKAAAPYLEATFSHKVKRKGGKNQEIPLLVADRSLHDVSDGAVLLGNLLALGKSRFDASSVLTVAEDGLVLRRHRIPDDHLAVWSRHLELVRMRWGLDVEHRAHSGLDAPGITVHTWLDVIERSLMGAVLPNLEDTQTVVGEISPVPYGDTASLDGLFSLVEILSALAELEHSSRYPKSVIGWCDEIERTLVSLCGDSCTEIDVALQVLDEYRTAALIGESDDGPPLLLNDTVTYKEFADLITTRLENSPGRQALRTGAVTATSFVPLRTVPFRVICFVGFDDGTLPVGDKEGDDLVALTPMLGDSDPRLEVRRVLLDAVMAARDRFIVTCTGKSMKNNKGVPLVTPLAEFLDYCKFHGVNVPDDPKKSSDIEYFHPRHKGSARNFQAVGGPVEGMIWSFDQSALKVAELSRSTKSESKSVLVAGSDTGIKAGEYLPEISIKDLELLVIDPLNYYLRKSLNVYTEYEEEDEGSTLPVVMKKFDFSNACEEILKNGISSDQEAEDARKVLVKQDSLPVSHLGDKVIREAKSLVQNYRKDILAAGIVYDPQASLTIELQIGQGTKVLGEITGFYPESSCISIISFHSSFDKDVLRGLVRLLVCRAMDLKISKAILIHKSDSTERSTKRIIELADDLTPAMAQERLEALVSVEPIARNTSCPEFGTTSSAMLKVDGKKFTIRDVEDLFDSYVEGFSFSKTKEHLIYGPQPDFKLTYQERWDVLLSFFQSFYGAIKLEVVQNGSSKGWVIKS